MICDKDCLHCRYQDCICDELDADDLIAEERLDRQLGRRKRSQAPDAETIERRKKRRAEQRSARYRAHIEEEHAKNRAYYIAHRDEIIAKVHDYQRKNRDKINARKRERYLAKKEAMQLERAAGADQRC